MSLLIWLDLSLLTLIFYLVLALSTGYLHGATGMAGGLVLASLLSHYMDIKAVVPMVTCALVISHSSRLFMYRTNVDWASVKTVLLTGLPMTILGAVTFGVLHSAVVSLIFAAVLSISFPLKAWASKRQLRTSQPVLAGAGGVWGLLAGCTIGPGFFLAPFLLGTNMNRLAFVGTLACCTLIMNLVKIGTFGTITLLTPQLAVLGILLGIATIPGNYAGKLLLHKMSDASHQHIINAMTLCAILNFLYIAWIES